MAEQDVVGYVLPFKHDGVFALGSLVLHYVQNQANDVGQSDEEAYIEGLRAVAANFTVADRPGVEPWVTNAAIVNPAYFGVTKPTIGAFLPTTVPLPTQGSGTTLGSVRLAAVVSKHTGLRGRSYRGRSYVPGINETAVSQGRIVTDARTYLEQLFDGLRVVNEGGLASPEFQMTVYSATLSKDQSVPVHTPVRSFTVRSIAGSQRRRSRVTE